MGTPILAITDGTTKVNLLTKTGAGINTCEYTPSRQIFKNDGIWADSSVSDGRQLQMRKWTNIIDVLSLVISGDSQDSVIENARRLTTLLEKAVQYWTTEWQNEPVWLERRGSNETNTSYTLIHSYKWANDDNPFAPPFYVTEKPFSMKDIDLALEHGPWLANAPGESECVKLANIMPSLGTVVTSSPTANADDAFIREDAGIVVTAYPEQSADDTFVDHQFNTIYNAAHNLYSNNDSSGFGREIGIRFKNVAVPNGATIIAARIVFVAHRKEISNNVRYYIRPERNATPATFSTYANFVARVKGSSVSQYEFTYRVEENEQWNTGDIAYCIQQVVDLGGWVSGQDIALFIQATSPFTFSMDYYSYDSTFAPRLEISYKMADTIYLNRNSINVAWDKYDKVRKDTTGIRFINVAVPNEAKILNAYLELTTTGKYNPSDGMNLKMRIKGEQNATPAIFSTYADFVGRTETDAISEKWDAKSWQAGTTVQSPDISNVIQEIIDLGGWVSGNNLVLFIKPAWGNNSSVSFASFENTTYVQAILTIIYATNKSYGQGATCEDQVYVSNKDNLAELTHIFRYNSATATWSANLLTVALPYELLSPLTVASALYIGSTLGVFCSAIFDLTQNYDGDLDWEYWDGLAWQPLTIYTDTPGAGELNYVLGVIAIAWRQPDDWAMTVINLVNAYWIRAIIPLGGTGTQPPIQSNRHVYTVTKSSCNIRELRGDISALAKLNITNLSWNARIARRIIIGLRSDSRGTNFRQHINTYDQNNNDIIITTDVDTASQAVVDTPTGTILRTSFTSPDTMERRFYFDIEPALTPEYYGRYRAFIRARETDGISNGDIRSYLKIILGASTTTKTVGNINSTGDWHYLDYGIITIPPALLPKSYEGSVTIEVWASNDYTSPLDFDWIDLILVPIDEYAIEAIMNDDAVHYRGDVLTLDSISYIGKRDVFSVLRYESDFQIHDSPLAISSGPVQLQANADQQLYFYVTNSSRYEWLGRLQAWDNERYLTLRGDS